MNLVAKLIVFVQLGKVTEFRADLNEDLLVGTGVAPETDPQVFVPYRKYHPINHISLLLIKRTTNHMQQKLEPSLVSFFFHIVFNWQSHHPLATILISWVFPLGSDSLLEDQIIGIRDHFSDRVSVIVHLPKFLDCAERIDLMENIVVIARVFLMIPFFLTMGQSVNIPESPPALSVIFKAKLTQRLIRDTTDSTVYRVQLVAKK